MSPPVTMCVANAGSPPKHPISIELARLPSSWPLMASAGILAAMDFSPASSSISERDLSNAQKAVTTLNEAFSSKIVGQEGLRTSLVVSLLTGGHILLESMPGLAKTLAVATMAASVSGSFKRIQCTPDLLPSDIIGSQIYDRNSAKFVTQLGPVHANFVLLDEVNRANAKTQSAMLEAMAEHQTTIGGVSYPLPPLSIVLATQNPVEQEGTYLLPEAQLDRFMLKEVITYPTPGEELEILKRDITGVFDDASPPRVTTDQVLAMQGFVKQVYIDPAVQRYIVSIVDVSRNAARHLDARTAGYIQYGASPRASLAFQAVSRAVALMNGRAYVIPEDVRALRYEILRHRLMLSFDAAIDKVSPDSIVDAIFAVVPTP